MPAMAEATRPYRHLCPEADERDAMTDDEFWSHVARNLGMPDPDDQPDWDGPDLNETASMGPCATCGETGACGYDSEGRALIHTTDPEVDHG